MSATRMIHIRIDDDLKEQASQTLSNMGLSVSDAVRVFLKRVVAEQAMPFDVKIPNATTRAAMSEADEIIRTRGARFKTAQELFDDLEKSSKS